MPSANPKVEKQASTETVEPIRQAITVIEHKIRNLEKRKAKLESYKDLQNNGKELEPEQKMAVAKYDVVLQLLDNTKEMHKQILTIANDTAKQQKRLARKEALDRLQQDIAKVREVLIIQHMMTNLGSESIRSDFLAGTNGAIQVAEEDMKYLGDLYSEIMLDQSQQDNTIPLQQQVQKIAEHYVAIIEGKQREVVGTTYNKIKEIVTSIHECGYFDRVSKVETVTEEATEVIPTTQIIETDSQEPRSEEFSSGGGERHIPPPESMVPMPNFPPVQVTTVPVVPGAAPVTGQIPVVAQAIPPQPVESSYYTNTPGFVPAPQPAQPGAPVPPTQPQPNQQSNQPQPNQQQTSNQQQQTPRINEVIGTPNFFFLQESELESPDVATPAPIVSHIPPTVNAPIPTQTFTNQNFAGAPVVPQVIYQPPPQDMNHIPGFTNPNPPPPIPMPPSHQQPNLQYSQQQPGGFQQAQDQPLTVIPQQTQFDQTHHAETEAPTNETKTTQDQNETTVGQSDHTQNHEVSEWSADTEGTTNDWNQSDDAQQSQDSQSHQTQQGWGEQRSSGYRGRGNRRGGNSNGYSGRPRTGGYQQNGRGGSQASYYRNENSSYQNGYHQRNWNNNSNSGSGSGGNSGSYNSGFKRTGGGPRGGGPGGARGERNAERGEGRGSGQFRGGQQRGGNRGYAPRGKPQAQKQ